MGFLVGPSFFTDHAHRASQPPFSGQRLLWGALWRGLCRVGGCSPDRSSLPSGLRTWVVSFQGQWTGPRPLGKRILSVPVAGGRGPSLWPARPCPQPCHASEAPLRSRPRDFALVPASAQPPRLRPVPGPQSLRSPLRDEPEGLWPHPHPDPSQGLLPPLPACLRPSGVQAEAAPPGSPAPRAAPSPPQPCSGRGLGL